ncbi:MAG: thermonuclease family protein, partial [Hyphomicrobium sp.]
LSPRASDARAAPGAWPAETAAVKLLTGLVLGHTVKLAYGKRHTDRYGRHLAHVFLNEGGKETWVQGELLSSGSARAYGLPGNFVCARELLAHERAARIAKLGVWDIALYRPKPARLAGLLMSRRSRFEIVEGPVASVSRTKSGAYLNFGDDWKTDFTARIGKDVLSAHPDFDDIVADLKDKTVTVRGWIERRNGPMIDIRDPSQLEISDPLKRAPEISAAPAPSAPKPTNAPRDSALQEPADDSGTNEKRPADPISEKPGAVDL